MLYMIQNITLINDRRGENYITQMFLCLQNIFKANSLLEMVSIVANIIGNFQLDKPLLSLDILKKISTSVNELRMANNPIIICQSAALDIYKMAFLSSKENE